MQARDGVFLEDLCPKLRARRWRQTLHELTDHRCLYCGAPSESIDHVFPRSRGGSSSDENCVPACLDCNGAKGDSEAFHWYRSQRFYDPRRAMALRAWVDGDRALACRLLSWTAPQTQPAPTAVLRPDPSADPSTDPSAVATVAGCLSLASDAAQSLAADDATAASSGQARSSRRKGRRGGREREGISLEAAGAGGPAPGPSPRSRKAAHQTRQAATPLWRWQMAS